jgi:hypothetical protein
MREVTDEEVATALHLAAEAEQRGDKDGWVMSSGFWHSDADARAIVRFCLILGLPISDTLSSQMFGMIVDEVLALRQAVTRLGGFLRQGDHR